MQLHPEPRSNAVSHEEGQFPGIVRGNCEKAPAPLESAVLILQPVASAAETSLRIRDVHPMALYGGGVAELVVGFSLRGINVILSGSGVRRNAAPDSVSAISPINPPKRRLP